MSDNKCPRCGANVAYVSDEVDHYTMWKCDSHCDWFDDEVTEGKDCLRRQLFAALAHAKRAEAANAALLEACKRIVALVDESDQWSDLASTSPLGEIVNEARKAITAIAKAEGK